MSTEALSQPMIDAAREGLAGFATSDVAAEERVVLRRDAPTWVRDLVYAAHRDGDLLPDRWRNAFTHDGLGQMASAVPGISRKSLASEIKPDAYTTPLVDWLAIGALRLAYCDQALANQPSTTTLDVLRRGQLVERLEIFDVVWNALATRVARPTEP